ncbi:MAG: ribosomal large subunit pseudouridine synthase [Labilithrix sp.]|nr:ribosomal large subunit pseudouridine synthase [Labilithrix sp.]
MFREELVLYEDDDLIAVDKPAGVPSQAASPDRPDDLVTRLKLFLAARDGQSDPYLGVHQRLDRDTSGVVLFTKKPDVNAALAKQFEGRTLVKQYLAAVTEWRGRPREVVLDDHLRKGDGGRMEVAGVAPTARAGYRRRSATRDAAAPPGRPPHRGARLRPTPGEPAVPPPTLAGSQRAVTRVTTRSATEGRALLELRLETGRTHQARVQLAHAGAPIAGDPLYGGGAAPRLMLHAAGLILAHPRTGKRLEIRAAVPPAMNEWMARGDLGDAVYDDVAALDRALALAVERRWGLGWSAVRAPEERRTTAFRLVNEDGDALPGLAVDVYGDHLVAQIYVGGIWEDRARRDRVLDRLGALGFAGVYVKLRPKQSNVLVDTRRDDVAPKLPVRGAPAPPELGILEEGVPYRVKLGDGLSTGIFLDQRPNRRLVRELAAGARVLNLFSYTCGFSVAAALGGATRTVSVDASALALEWGRQNFLGAGITLGVRGPGEPHTFVAEDVFSWLTRAASKAERFDLVIVDPPSYSSTKKRRFVAETDYGELVAMVAKVLAPHGKVLASCNHRGLARGKLRRLVAQGLEGDGRALAQLKDLPDAPDFPPGLGRDVFMKSVLASLV